jgi:hypothetical protein
MVMTDENMADGRPAPANKPRKREPGFTVRAQYVVVDGPDGEALERLQAQAIRRALQWFADHPEAAEASEPEW